MAVDKRVVVAGPSFERLSAAVWEGSDALNVPSIKRTAASLGTLTELVGYVQLPSENDDIWQTRVSGLRVQYEVTSFVVPNILFILTKWTTPVTVGAVPVQNQLVGHVNAHYDALNNTPALRGAIGTRTAIINIADEFIIFQNQWLGVRVTVQSDAVGGVIDILQAEVDLVVERTRI
jgi:hypothetical protein